MQPKEQVQGNFLAQTAFPWDNELASQLQNNQNIVSVLGNIGGNKIILSGCGLYNANTSRYPGYVFLRTQDFPEGEVLYFSGGSVQNGMFLEKQAIDITADGTTYVAAYTIRKLTPGIGPEQHDWNDFIDVNTINIRVLKDTCEELKQKIELLTPPPLGIVQIFAGTISGIPENYLLCDGRELLRTEYAQLFAVLGTQYNTAKNYAGVVQTTSAGMFRLPDLRGRFLVGYNESANDADYSVLGNADGEKRHVLTIPEMPAHTHSYPNPSSAQNINTAGNAQLRPGTGSGTTSSTGGGQSHENRPPYYTLAYIVRVK